MTQYLPIVLSGTGGIRKLAELPSGDTLYASGLALSGLSDTQIVSPVSGNALVWNTSKWVASAVTYPSPPTNIGTSSLSGLLDTSVVSSISQYQILTWSGTGANAKWSPSSLILSVPTNIGTSSLSGLLDTSVVTPGTGQTLTWSSTKWVASTLTHPTDINTDTSTLSALGDTSVPASVLQYQILTWSGTGGNARWSPSSITYPSPPTNIGTSSLSGLLDTSVVAPSKSQILTWSGTGGDARWAPSSLLTPSRALNDLTDVVITSVATYQPLVFDGFFWSNNSFPHPAPFGMARMSTAGSSTTSLVYFGSGATVVNTVSQTSQLTWDNTNKYFTVSATGTYLIRMVSPITVGGNATYDISIILDGVAQNTITIYEAGSVDPSISVIEWVGSISSGSWITGALLAASFNSSMGSGSTLYIQRLK